MRRPLTVTKLSDRFGDYTLIMTCRRCKHARHSDPHAIAKILGWETPLTVVATRLRCSNCHAKDVEITTELSPRPRGIAKNQH